MKTWIRWALTVCGIGVVIFAFREWPFWQPAYLIVGLLLCGLSLLPKKAN